MAKKKKKQQEEQKPAPPDMIPFAEALALYDALRDAEGHLSYCGYGDGWERECAFSEKLPEKLEVVMESFASKYDV